jgi:hypothetical protein
MDVRRKFDEKARRRRVSTGSEQVASNLVTPSSFHDCQHD